MRKDYKFRGRNSLRRHNKEGQWKRDKVVDVNYNEAVGKNERRDIHKRVTGGHSVSIDGEYDNLEMEHVLGYSARSHGKYAALVMPDMTVGEALENMKGDMKAEDALNFEGYLRTGGEVRFRNSFYAGSSTGTFIIHPMKEAS